MALLHACVEGGAECVAVHCDFHLRGEESERDREFVEERCRCLGVPLRVVHFDVPAYRREHGVSLEMACRELRYAAFERLAAEEGCVRIAVGHNRDDNDETMLLNLLRGTGIAGLCGMSADTGRIVRPMLGISRAEIEEYMNHCGYSYITDSSNLTSDFKRNFIRRELLPLIAVRWPGVSKSLARTRTNLAETRRVCEKAMAPWLAKDPCFLSAEAYVGAPSRALLLMDWLEGRGASSAQIDEMAAGLRPGRRWAVREGEVCMSREGLRFHGKEEMSAMPECKGGVLPLTEETMRMVRTNIGEATLYYSGAEKLTLRPARKADRMAPMGMSGTKLVSDLLREAGVDVSRRRNYPVCVDSSDRIIWIPRVKRSRHLAVRPGRDCEVFWLRLVSEL